MRLNKFLASQSQLSRRNVDNAISEGLISVNNETATLGQQLLNGDVVEFDNELFVYSEDTMTTKLLIALNKPQGVISTCDLDEPNNIISFIKENCKNPLLAQKISETRLFPIGRLDKDSRGLILLTNDGQLTYELTHPKFAHQKEYIVNTTSNIDSSFINKLRSGISFQSETGLVTSKPCFAEQVDDKVFRITLEQGYKRQIRLMTEALGNRVSDLFRIRIADIALKTQYTESTNIRLLLDLEEAEFIEIKY